METTETEKTFSDKIISEINNKKEDLARIRRDQFAAFAMQGIMASREKVTYSDFMKDKEMRLKIAVAAALYADELIRILDTKNGEL